MGGRLKSTVNQMAELPVTVMLPVLNREASLIDRNIFKVPDLVWLCYRGKTEGYLWNIRTGKPWQR